MFTDLMASGSGSGNVIGAIYVGDSVYTAGEGLKDLSTIYILSAYAQYDSVNKALKIQSPFSATIEFSSLGSLTETYELRLNGTTILSVTGSQAKTTTINLSSNDAFTIYRNGTGTSDKVRLVIYPS
jgi:hypothetical protein